MTNIFAAGPTGVEPATLGLKALYQFCRHRYRTEDSARTVYSLINRHMDCYINPHLLLSLPEKKQSKVLYSLVCYSRFRGEYEAFKTRYKAAGVKWGTKDGALNGFLSMISKEQEGLATYLQQIKATLTLSEQVYVELLATTGLRSCEALESFNLIIKLHTEGRLGEYYNQQLQCLEHYRHRDLFLRRTKNCYISFVPQSLVTRICRSQPINYNRLKCALKRGGFKLRLKQLRSNHNTFLHKAGVQSEWIDMLAGRIPAQVLVRHYLRVDLQSLGTQVLAIELELLRGLLQ